MADLSRLLRTSMFQLTVLYAALFALSMTIVAGFLYWSTIGAMQAQTDATIEAEITGLAEQYRSLGLPRLVQVIRKRIEADPDSGAIYLIADRNSRPLAGNLDQWPALASRDDGWYSFSHHSPRGDVAARARVFALKERLVLLVGREIPALDQTASLFLNALFWGGGIAVVLALIGGGTMSASVLRRVEQINVTTEQIMMGKLSERIATRNTGDEFDQLATNLNRMLEEIEHLLDSVRHVADNIAHDLRTPLTRLRNSLEQAAQESDPAAGRQHVQAALDDADNLLRTFSALLRIARLESGGYESETGELALGQLLEDAVDLYKVAAEAQGIALQCSLAADARIHGDRDLLFQLLVNLIDNAVKHTPAGGEIKVSLAAADDEMMLIVADTGPGIPGHLRDRVLERFFRVDSSRGTAGNGLGLSLVKAIADYHRAELALGDNDPGLRVELRFASV